MKTFVKNLPWQKIGKKAVLIAAGVSAAMSAIDSKKKEEEFEQLKKTVKQLQEKE